jgi:hypothetical protein
MMVANNLGTFIYFHSSLTCTEPKVDKLKLKKMYPFRLNKIFVTSLWFKHLFLKITAFFLHNIFLTYEYLAMCDHILRSI